MWWREAVALPPSSGGGATLRPLWWRAGSRERYPSRRPVRRRAKLLPLLSGQPRDIRWAALLSQSRAEALSLCAAQGWPVCLPAAGGPGDGEGWPLCG